MASQAPFEFKVGFAHVAIAALRDVVLRGRAVSCVTILACDHLMFAPIGVYVGRRARMTLNAVR